MTAAPIDDLETVLERATYLAAEIGIRLDTMHLEGVPDALAVMFQIPVGDGEGWCNQLLVASDASTDDRAAVVIHAVALATMCREGAPDFIDIVRCLEPDAPADTPPYIAFSRTRDLRKDAPAANLAKLIGQRIGTDYPVFRLFETRSDV